MQTTIRLFDLLQKRALVTRASARSLESQLAGTKVSNNGSLDIALDFQGIEAVTPSFVDEILGVVMEAGTRSAAKSLRVTFIHPPTRLSSKFSAIARARGVVIEEIDGAWSIAQKSA